MEYIWMMGKQELIDALNKELPDWEFSLKDEKLYGVKRDGSSNCAFKFPEQKNLPIFKEKVKDYLEGKITSDVLTS